MASITFSGLASGLDTSAMIKAILDFESQPLDRLQSRQQTYSARKAALEVLRGKLNDFEGAIRDLSAVRTFRGRNTTVSDQTILRASAGAGAETGLFEIEVTGLASASKVKSAGLAASDQGLVTAGTLTIQAGGNDAITIDVDSAAGTNSLQGIRDAINAADAGVQAAIVFDGTDYRLSVRSEETGTDNALTITDTTNLDLDEASNAVSTAADATLVVDGIEVTSSSNRVTGVLPGVTLDLLSETEAGSPITVEVGQDIDGVVEATQSLVTSYNDLVEYFNAQFNRDNPGPLSGDPTALRIQTTLQSLFTGGVTGIPFGSIRSLSAIGVSFDGKTGEASLDTAELRELLGTSFDEVGNLFLSSGSTSDPRIRYSASTASTAAGTYAVQITQAAEQAVVSGGTAIGTLGQDETLTISVDGESTDVALTAGMDATAVLSTINGALRDAGVSATASSVGGVLTLTSRDFGSSIELSVTSDRTDPGDGSGTGFGTTATTDTGVDVAGSIDGVEASGAGQALTASVDSDATGLVLRIAASAADVTATGGDFGSVSYSVGFVDTILSQVDEYTRLGEGPLDLAKDTLDAQLDQISRDIERLQDKLAVRERQLTRAFGAAEQAIQALQTQQASLGNFTVI